MTIQNPDRLFTVALARGLEILNCFHPEEDMLGNGEIAERTGLPKATITRLTYTLSRLGYLVHYPEKGKYGHGPELANLGYKQLTRMKTRRLARPLMQALAEYSQGSVNFAVPDGLNMVYIDTYRTSATINLQLEVGSHVPVARSAMGRAYLSTVSESKRKEIFGQIQNMEPERWEEAKRGLDVAMEEFKQRGFCLSLGEWRKEVHSVAVPLMIDEAGPSTKLFSCGGPSFLFTKEKLETDIGPRLLNLVSNVESALKTR